MDDIDETEEHIQHVYDFSKLERAPEGPTSLTVTGRRLLSGATIETAKSSTVGAVLSGRRIICTLAHQPAGTGAKPHTHPNEQFNYIVQGTMLSDVEGDRVFASKGTILHTPGMAVHTGLACPDDDLIFLAIKDTRHGIVGPPVDGRYDGPNCLPGFGSRSDEPRITTSELIEQSKALPKGPGKRYVYDMRTLDDALHEPASAHVTLDADLRLPPRITGKLLTGERLHVCVLHLEPGATISNYRKDNEQLVFAAEGELDVDLEDEPLVVPQRCVLHIPPGVRHQIVAPEGALIVIAQDKGVAEASS